MWRLAVLCWLFYALCVSGITFPAHRSLSSNSDREEDTRSAVDFRTLLEGVTEPFSSSATRAMPLWQEMKLNADTKAANMLFPQAAKEYVALLRHASLFTEMPLDARYEVFLSLAQLMRMMGFPQRAELLLYEATSYVKDAFAAHRALASLSLQREDRDRAKQHLKNCLVLRERDAEVLVSLSALLWTEGRVQEAKFFLSRAVEQLLSLSNHTQSSHSAHTHTTHTTSTHNTHTTNISMYTNESESDALILWFQEFLARVLHGEFRLSLSSHTPHNPPTHTTHSEDSLSHFTDLLRALTDDSLSPQRVFSVGEYLCAQHRPRSGHSLMERALSHTQQLTHTPHTSHNALSQDETQHTQHTHNTTQMESMQLRLSLHVPRVSSSLSLSVTSYLHATQFLALSAHNFSRALTLSTQDWRSLSLSLSVWAHAALPVAPLLRELSWRVSHSETHTARAHNETDTHRERDRERGFNATETALCARDVWRRNATTRRHRERDALCESLSVSLSPRPGSISPIGTGGTAEEVRVGVLSAHWHAHPVGLALSQRLHTMLLRERQRGRQQGERRLSLTLLSLPERADALSRSLAALVDRVVPLPFSPSSLRHTHCESENLTQHCLAVAEDAFAEQRAAVRDLGIDVLIVTDVPDALSLSLSVSRLAPVQVCLSLLGGSCAFSSHVDYVLLPAEWQAMYERAVPATDRDATREVTLTQRAHTIHTKKRRASQGVPFTREDIGEAQTRRVLRPVRPAWREVFAEQAVLLDVPLLSAQSVALAVRVAHKLEREREREREKERARGADELSVSHDFSLSSSTTAVECCMSSATSSAENAQCVCAVVLVSPAHTHALWDASLLRVLRAHSALQLVLAVPRSALSLARGAMSAQEQRAMSDARYFARRLEARAGSLSHRIRLLPTSFSDVQLLQLFRHADLVLDSLPIGLPAHYLALSLSTGTPMVTLSTGTVIESERDDLQEIRRVVAHYRAHPLYTHVFSDRDVPWSPSVSHIAGFYERVGLADALVAKDVQHYVELASAVLADREEAYRLRVQLLDALDRESERESAQMNDGEEDDMARFLFQVGTPWYFERMANISQFNRGKKRASGFLLSGTAGAIK